MSNIRFLVSPWRRIVMLLLTFVVGLVVTGLAGGLLLNMGGPDKAVAMSRIATVIQDIFMLIMPALVTALIVTRQPVKLLALGRMPSAGRVLIAIAVMLLASPAMSWIIELNSSIQLPESLGALEQKMRAMEDSAQATLDFMLGAHTPANLFVNILLIGLLAGFSEELFFRGALQRLINSTGLSVTAAIWISAIIFSAIHMQFYGFVPRMLLGVYFGYLLVWSGSVWLPVIVHAFNNSMFLVLKYMTGNGDPSIGAEGSMESVIAIIASVLATAAGLILLYKTRDRQASDNDTTNHNYL